MKLLQIASGDFLSTYGGGQVYVKSIVDKMIRQELDVAVISFVGKEIIRYQRGFDFLLVCSLMGWCLIVF